MENKKRKKHLFLKILASLFAVWLGACLFFNFTFAFSQYDHNMKLWETYQGDIINDQHLFEAYKYGFGNVSKNGCGSIAIYNVLKLNGKDANLPDIIKKMQIMGLPAWGLLGTSPYKVVWGLRSYGYNVKYSFKTKDFEKIASEHDFSIYCYIHFNYGHYMVLTPNDDQTFTMYNPYQAQTTINTQLEQTKESVFKMLIYMDKI